MNTKIINPILPGFYPDPSVCAAGGKFYLVNSTFSYFPGLPVFESDDGVSWKQIGNIIDRESQLDFSGAGVSRGLFAPTIRFYGGKFYCVCTLVDKIGNFIVSADRPEGPWSDPVEIRGAEGIDPSLFFDDDGTAWYIGTRPAPEGPKWNGNWEVWIQRIDVKTGTLLGESRGIWRGALKHCIWPEGPHIYKINGMYYLIHAEGGTGPDHAVCVARCASIDGEWTGKPANPVLTHRHLGETAGVTCVGHADLFCKDDGTWWMVCLASRPYGDGNSRCSNLGRETFIVPVRWENGWPVVSWQTGLVENAYNLDGSVAVRQNSDRAAALFPEKDGFDSPEPEMYWLSLRSRHNVSLSERRGWLRLYGGDELCGNGDVSLFARRQTSFSWRITAEMEPHLVREGESAGLVCFQSEKFNLRLAVTRCGGADFVQVLRFCGSDRPEILASVEIPASEDRHFELEVIAERQNLSFSFSTDGGKLNLLAENVDGSILSVEKAGGFVGTVLGMFAESPDGNPERQMFADFDSFAYYSDEVEWTDEQR